MNEFQEVTLSIQQKPMFSSESYFIRCSCSKAQGKEKKTASNKWVSANLIHVRHQLQCEKTLEGLKRNYWAVFCVVFSVNITAHKLISAFFFLFGHFSASFVWFFFHCFCLRLWTLKHRLSFFFLDSGQVVEIQLWFNWVRSKFVTHLHETNKDFLYPK